MFASAANARAGVEGPILPDGERRWLARVACLAPSRGFKLYNRKVGDQRSRIRLLKNTVHVFGAALVVVTFRQRAGVEKIVWHSALLPESDNGLGKRARDCGQCASHFIQRDIVMSGFCPLFGREVSRNVLADGRCVGDSHSHLLPLFKRYRLQRLEHAVLVHGLKSLLHMASV